MKREPTAEEREKIGSAIAAGDRMNCALYFGHAAAFRLGITPA
jgi:hypothetical protein